MKLTVGGKASHDSNLHTACLSWRKRAQALAGSRHDEKIWG